MGLVLERMVELTLPPRYLVPRASVVDISAWVDRALPLVSLPSRVLLGVCCVDGADGAADTGVGLAHPAEVRAAHVWSALGVRVAH